MPNKKSAAKRVRQNKKRAARNRAAKSTLRTFVRKVRRAIEEENPDAARTALPQAIRVINKTAQKGIIHKKKAARLESRLVKRVNSLGPPPPENPPS